MSQEASLYLDTSHVEELQAMKEEGEADSVSEAARKVMNAGLVEMGRLNGRSASHVGWMAREIAKLWAYMGIAFLAFTFLFPVSFRVWTVFFFLAALASYGIGAVADRGMVPLPGGERTA